MENYSDLLKKSSWHTKCINIINRDNHKCSVCGKIGYHNATTMTYQKAEELDKVFSEMTFDGNTISTFFNSLVQNEDKYIDIFATYRNNEDGSPCFWNNYYCPEVFVKTEDEINNPFKYFAVHSVVKKNLFFRVMPDSEQPINDSKIKGFGIDDVEILSTHCRNILFHAGGIFKFPTTLTNKYIVTIQCTFAGIVADQYGSSKYSDLIINISHNNYCLSLYIVPFDKGFNKILPGLNVHHKYYISGKSPWEYDDDALITLCEDCHRKTHEINHIPIYKDIKGGRIFIKNAETCDRCGGSGYLPQYEHVENGICFKCWGEGVILPE